MTDLYTDLDQWTWHSAVTKPLPQHRDMAARQLAARGYRVLLPMCRELVTKAGKSEPVTRPMFGRYVFVGVAPGQESWDIRWVPGVQHMTLDAKRRPVVVPRSALAAIVARMDPESGVIDLCPCHRPRQGSGFIAGEVVRVQSGPFAGFEALFEGDQGQRCRVLLSLFGREMTMLVEAKDLATAAE